MGYTILKHHGTFNRRKRTEEPRYILVHYTGSGGTAKGAALANCKYFGRANRNASAHYFVDDGSIYEYADPKKWYTWHCGDGHGKYGITNANSIGIEVCRSGDKPYTSAEIARLTWLVQKLMKEFDVPASRVVRHYDASRKACPLYYTPSGKGGNSAWKALHAKITGGSSSASASVKCTAYKVDAANGLNLRKGPGTSYAKAGAVADGDVILVQSISNGWAKTKNGKYCSAQYLTKCTASYPYVVTASSGLNFREGPGTSYAKTRVVDENLRVYVYGFRGDWALTTKGDWCHKSYLKKLTKKTVDAKGGLNCRKGPGTRYARTRLLADGSAVYIRSVSDGWAKTQAGDWCSAKYLK